MRRGLVAFAILSSSIAAAEQTDGSEEPRREVPELKFRYDEITDAGAVLLNSVLLASECGQHVGYGVMYMTSGDPHTSRKVAVPLSMMFVINRALDVADFEKAIPDRASVPYLIDGKRGTWRGGMRSSKVKDCNLESETCTYQLEATVQVPKALLKKLVSSKRARIRPFSGVDCELNAESKAFIARFLRDAPALK